MNSCFPLFPLLTLLFLETGFLVTTNAHFVQMTMSNVLGFIPDGTADATWSSTMLTLSMSPVGQTSVTMKAFIEPVNWFSTLQRL